MLLLCIFLNLWFLVPGKDGAPRDCPPMPPDCPPRPPDCPRPRPQCSLNEVVDECVNWNKYCNPHCPLQFEPKIGCTNDCTVGCACRPGYIRDIDTELCIDDRYCPAPGDENTHFTRCDANEQVYCWNCHDKPFSYHENKQNCVCIPGYVCKPGYAKNAAGYCVPFEACDNINVPPVGAEE